MEKLALLGGKKAITLDYQTVANRPLVNKKGLESAMSLLERGEISISKSVYEFEDRFAAYVGAKYGLACCSGTACLHTALFAVGVGPGDEVIVPSFTFWASMGPIYWVNATPVFCEADMETHCIDPEDIVRKITPKTKAIMPVHVWGNACNMDAIMKIAKEYNLRVIEDCSHAHGTKYKGQNVGTFGDIGCYSLQGSKLMPAGEAGILVTNNKELYERSLSMGHYDRLAGLDASSPSHAYALTGMGLKLRPHPVAIALANSCLDELDERNAIRNTNALAFEKQISDIDFLSSQKILDGAERQFSYHYMNYYKEKFNDIHMFTFLKALAAEGVTCGYCGYGRLHQSPLVLEGGPFGICGAHDKPVSLPVTEQLARVAFMAAPRFENDCPELIKQYADAYHKVAENIEDLTAFDRQQDYSGKLNDLSGRSIATISGVDKF